MSPHRPGLRRGAMVRGLAVLALLAVPGCSGPAEPPAAETAAVGLSSDAPDANAPAVAAFFQRTCLEASASSAALAQALQGSGWRHELIQAASGAMPIASWRLDHGTLIHTAFPLGPGGGFVDCRLDIDAAFAPGLERMRDTLRPIVAHPSLREVGADSREVRWRWRPSPDEERDLAIATVPTPGGTATAPRPGLAIQFGARRAGPAPDPAVSENVQ